MNLFYSKFKIYGSIHEEIITEFQAVKNCKITLLNFVNLFFSNVNLFSKISKFYDFIATDSRLSAVCPE